MRYPGGKSQAGVYQRIISLMPPHDVYIETHAGGGNILERKRPARESWAVDIDQAVVATLAARHGKACNVVYSDAVDFLRRFDFAARRVLIYSDPPYVMATRKSGPLYRHEYSDEQHHELLNVLCQVPALVMLSGYRCPMYDAALSRWHRVDYPVMTRGGSWAVESLWLNFDPPAWPHDVRYVGADYRDRWRMKKKRRRWRSMLERMPAHERAAMLALLLELTPPEAALGSSAPGMALQDPAPAVAVGAGDARPAAPSGALVDVMDPRTRGGVGDVGSAMPGAARSRPLGRPDALAGRDRGEGRL